MDYTRVHRNTSMVLLQSSTTILRTRSFHNFLKHWIYLYPPTVCRTVLGQEETLTNCLLFRFHVSAFLFEFMFCNAEEKKKSKVTDTKSAMQPLHYFIYNTIQMLWVSNFFLKKLSKCALNSGLHYILHAIVMRISSVKPVLWFVINLHHLFSNGAAFNTQSRSLFITNHRTGFTDEMRMTIACDILCSPN